MDTDVARHYAGDGELVAAIAAALRTAGIDPSRLRPADLASVDEFHIRGREATLELAGALALTASSRVLDIGSGLGGPARTIAEQHGCRVTGVDLTPAFCAAATTLRAWVGLGDRVDFRHGDATALPFAAATFDAALSIHVGMNVAAKDRMYAEARRVLVPGGRFAVYDVVQGDGGAVLYPVPWAREPSISHVVTVDAMTTLLTAAGLTILGVQDSSAQSLRWFEALAGRAAQGGPAVTFRTFLGDDFPTMARNQVRNLQEGRIRTVSFVCAA